jgi:molybdopterin converting factor small subunit
VAKTVISLRLREKLGFDESEDLATAIEDAKVDMLAASQERFEARLSVVSMEIRAEIARTQAELRQEIANGDTGLRIALAEGLSRLRNDMSDWRVDVLRWSFLFWIGQVAATAALLSFILRH